MTAKSNEIELLLNSEELLTVYDIQKEFKVYKNQYEEFIECNCAVVSCLNDKEKEVDQQFWFQSKTELCLQFMAKVKRWIEAKT